MEVSKLQESELNLTVISTAIKAPLSPKPKETLGVSFALT